MFDGPAVPSYRVVVVFPGVAEALRSAGAQPRSFGPSEHAARGTRVGVQYSYTGYWANGVSVTVQTRSLVDGGPLGARCSVCSALPTIGTPR